MKKIIALTMAGVMFCGMTAFASPSTTATDTAKKESTEAPVSQAEAVVARITQEAAAVNKSAVEYTNNAVAELPGVPEVVPMGQGGHVIINGAPSNVVFYLDKPAAATVKAATAQAAELGGKLLNVVTTKSPVVGKFATAQVNFYAKGVIAGQNIKVYQLVDGVWVEVEIVEIREDHVVINMTQHGTLAFVEVPAAVPAA